MPDVREWWLLISHDARRYKSKFASIAIICHGNQGTQRSRSGLFALRMPGSFRFLLLFAHRSLYPLCTGAMKLMDGPPMDIKALKDSKVASFWKRLAACVAPGGRIDLLGCRLVLWLVHPCYSECLTNHECFQRCRRRSRRCVSEKAGRNYQGRLCSLR